MKNRSEAVLHRCLSLFIGGSIAFRDGTWENGDHIQQVAEPEGRDAWILLSMTSCPNA